MSNFMKRLFYNNSAILLVSLFFGMLSLIFSVISIFTNDIKDVMLYLIFIFIAILNCLIFYNRNKIRYNIFDINLGYFKKTAYINQKNVWELKKLQKKGECANRLMLSDKKNILEFIKNNKDITFYSVTFEHMIEKVQSLEGVSVDIYDLDIDEKEKYEKYISTIFSSKCDTCRKKDFCEKLRGEKNTKMYAIKIIHHK